MSRSDILLTRPKSEGEDSERNEIDCSRESASSGADDVIPLQECPTLANLMIASVPKEHQEGGLYGIVPQDAFWKTVNISAKYLSNTLLIKELSTSTEDQRIKIIAAVGTAATAIAPFFLVSSQILSTGTEEGKPGRLRLPVVIDAYQEKNKTWAALPRNRQWWYKVVVEDIAKNRDAAIDREEFFKAYGEAGDETRVFAFSSCREATLYLAYGTMPAEPGPGQSPDTVLQSTSVVSFKVKVSDPDRLQTIALPMKGTIKMHTQCGADVEVEPIESKDWDAVRELFNQAKAVKEAQKAAAKAK